MSDLKPDVRKAAIILMMVKSDMAGKFLQEMTRLERSEISKAMSQLGAVSSDDFNQVLEEAIGCLNNTSVVGNSSNTRDLLSSVLVEDEVNEIMAHIEWTTWQKISRLKPEILADYLSKEHIQVAAVILSFISPEAISSVLAECPEELAQQIMLRLTNLQTIDPELVKIIEDSIKFDWDNISGKTDFKKLVRDVFDNFDEENGDKFIKVLEEHNQELAEVVKKGMFSFNDLSKLGDKGMQDLIREVPKDKLVIALKSASEELKGLVYKNMSERAARIMKDDMEAVGPIRVKEIEKAQNDIAKVVKYLIKEGIIIFGDDIV